MKHPRLIRGSWLNFRPWLNSAPSCWKHPSWTKNFCVKLNTWVYLTSRLRRFVLNLLVKTVCAHCVGPWESVRSTRPWTHVRVSLRLKLLITTQLMSWTQMLSPKWRHKPNAKRSSSWALALTASAKVSSLTTPVSTPHWSCRLRVMKPSWLTATQRLSPPTMTPQTACTSSH